jgi:RNA polymerase sigma factor (sigma-70 family)
MAKNTLRQALQHLQQLLRPPGEDERTDGQLLARFVALRDESAFAALVHRHGPMVLSVCRRILRHNEDAEDAFQAAFLVLARKADSVLNHQALGSWLYRVAYRIALEAKAANDKRRRREKQMEELPHPQIAPVEAPDWRSWLVHELNLLPERYRAVVVACDLEERSRKEAAHLLGLAEGTVSSRLARGRRLLAKRLSRYGLSLTGATLAAALAQEAAAAVPAALRSALVLAVSGQTMVSVSVGLLTKGALKAMFLTKLKWGVGVVVVVAALGASGLAYRASGQAAAAPAIEEAHGKAPSEVEILRREVELLKLKMEAVQEKQRMQEKQLHALQGRAQVEKESADYEATIRAARLKREAARRQEVEELKAKEKEKQARAERELWEERARWSERMSLPSRQYVTIAQAQADQARLQEARRRVRAMDEQIRLQQVETALNTLRGTRDSQAKRRALDDLEKASRKLRELMDKEKDESPRPTK